MVAQLGLCGLCGTTKDCHVSTDGYVCHDCWIKAAKDPASNVQIEIPPDPGTRINVITGPNGYITIHGTLYGYTDPADAEMTLGQLRREFPLPGVVVQEVDAMEPFLYAKLHPGIRMLAVNGLRRKQ